MTDGAPNFGTAIREGDDLKFTEENSPNASEFWPYANGVLKKYEEISNDYNIFSVAFFHSRKPTDEKDVKKNNENLIKNQKDGYEIGEKLLKLSNNSGYYEASDGDSLNKIYKKIAKKIEVPIRINLSYKIDYNNPSIFYIYAQITNKSNIKLENLYLDLVKDNRYRLDEIIYSDILTTYSEEVEDYVETEEKRSEEDFITLNPSATTPFKRFKIQVIDDDLINIGGTLSLQVRGGGEYTDALDSSTKVIEELNQSLTLTLNVKNDRDNYIKSPEDHWRFKNFAKSIKLSDSEKYMMLENLIPTERERMINSNYFEKNKFTGHCFGMSVTTILNKMNVIDNSTLKYKDYIGDGKKNDNISMIQYYHLFQFLNPLVREKERFNKLDDIQKANEIIAKVEEVKNGGAPVLLCFTPINSSNSGVPLKGAHAVVAHQIEKLETKENNKYNYKIHLYDSNIPNPDENKESKTILGIEYDYKPVYLLINSNNGDWEIIGKNYDLVNNDTLDSRDVYNELVNGVLVENKASIELATNNLSIINAKEYMAQKSNYNTLVAYFLSTNNEYKIKSDNFVWSVNLINMLATPDLSYFTDSHEIDEVDSGLTVLLPNLKTPYYIENSNGKPSDIKVTMEFGETYASALTELSESVVLYPNGKVIVNNNEGNFTISLSENNPTDKEFATYRVEGKANETIEVTRTDEGVIINGKIDDGTLTTVTKEGEEETTPIVYPESDKNSVEYKKIDEKIVPVKDDSNNGNNNNNNDNNNNNGSNNENNNGNNVDHIVPKYPRDDREYPAYSNNDGISFYPGMPWFGDGNKTTETPVTPVTPVATGLPFKDVLTSDWFYDAVKSVYGNKVMVGVTDDIFEPAGIFTRAQMAQVIYNLENKPSINSKSNFSDVADSSWYNNAVAWCEQNEIIKGFEDGTFKPDSPITRQEIATILFRYAGFKGIDTNNSGDLSKFIDNNTVSDFAVDAMKWAAANNIFKGDDNNNLRPLDKATRAEVAQIMANSHTILKK